MAYFNFNYVTDPPLDETVNVQQQLNDNWQDINDKIKPFNRVPNNIVGAPLGTEALYPGSPSSDHDRIAVWDGTDWRRSINHSTVWGPWTPLTLRAPVVFRPGFPVMAKVDSVTRRVIFSGGVLFNAAADPWPTGSNVEITNNTDIAAALSPVTQGITYYQAATGQVTAANSFASAVIKAELLAGPPTRVALTVRYQGDAGGGNFVMLDGLMWWY